MIRRESLNDEQIEGWWGSWKQESAKFECELSPFPFTVHDPFKKCDHKPNGTWVVEEHLFDNDGREYIVCFQCCRYVDD
jgi:hypothetical protein